MKVSRISLIVAGIFSIIIGLVSFRFLALDMNLAFPDFAKHINNRNLTLLAHISATPIALIIGAIQLLPKKRAKKTSIASMARANLRRGNSSRWNIWANVSSQCARWRSRWLGIWDISRTLDSSNRTSHSYGNSP